MKLYGTWDDRVTQDMDPMSEAGPEMSATPNHDSEVEVFAITEPEPEPELELEPQLESILLPIPWDHGLSVKERKKKQKAMQIDGTWCHRITQEMIDEENAVTEATAVATIAHEESTPSPELARASSPLSVSELEPLLEPETEPVTVPGSDSGPVKEKLAWDFDLSPKEKKKKRRHMMLDGTWETRLTQEIIDKNHTAAAAAIAGTEDVEVEPELDVESPPIVEESCDWNWGTWAGAKSRAKEKESIHFSDPELEPEPVPQVKKEEAVEEIVGWDTWGFVPGTKKKNKKRACSVTEPIFEPEAESGPESHPTPVREPERPIEDPYNWNLRQWDDLESGVGKQQEPTPHPDPEPAPQQEEPIDEPWDIPISSLKKKKKDKKKPRPIIEFICDLESQTKPTTEDSKESSSLPGFTGNSGKSGPCINRSHHLLEKSEWQVCPVCIDEVTEMARKAARVWV